jgi:hypothetical protein
MWFLWFAHGCLRILDWQLSIIEALMFRVLVRMMKRMTPDQLEKFLRRIGDGES